MRPLTKLQAEDRGWEFEPGGYVRKFLAGRWIEFGPSNEEKLLKQITGREEEIAARKAAANQARENQAASVRDLTTLEIQEAEAVAKGVPPSLLPKERKRIADKEALAKSKREGTHGHEVPGVLL